jgi:hypothetical protein
MKAHKGCRAIEEEEEEEEEEDYLLKKDCAPFS